MAYSFNGIGTEYHGKREVNTDGSYITTKFFCICSIPLIPLSSYRVVELGGRRYYFGGSSQQYRTMQVDLNWKQIGNIFLVEALIIGALFAVWFLHERHFF
jgi:hypothetical protein